MTGWLDIKRGEAPLVVAFPHTGTDLAATGGAFRCEWIARRDADWWVDRLYDFAAGLGATTIRTDISRSVIDVNRDPSGASLYPGQATTELCPTTTFDGEPLYRDAGPDADEIARRRSLWFTPYHAALEAEIARLRSIHPRIVVYDAHSIRSHVPRLFDGELPQFNIGTNSGQTCAEALTKAVVAACNAFPGESRGPSSGGENGPRLSPGNNFVLDGRFKGGWTTRHYGRPNDGIHAIQMELAMRGYLDEPDDVNETNWPALLAPARANNLTPILKDVLQACIAFAAA